MDEPHWLADEMLGRLARYLRFLGYDAEYARGVSDDEIVQRARAEGRRVVTRDRRLAGRLPDAVLLIRSDIAGQMQELDRAIGGLRHEVRFVRCSTCNGGLSSLGKLPAHLARQDAIPVDVRGGITPVYACSRCGHLYWEGTHTRSVRARLAQWFPSPPVDG
ncbi:MAG: Mut7-C RNAse domain-containing protein [Thermoplasmata archaeon]